MSEYLWPALFSAIGAGCAVLGYGLLDGSNATIARGAALGLFALAGIALAAARAGRSS